MNLSNVSSITEYSVDSEDERREFIKVANELFSKLNMPPVRFLSECTAATFVSLYEGIFGDSLKGSGLVPSPITRLDEILNCQLVLDALSQDILHTDLSHISAEAVVARDQLAIRNLIEIFSGVFEYVTETIDSTLNTDDSDYLAGGDNKPPTKTTPYFRQENASLKSFNGDASEDPLSSYSILPNSHKSFDLSREEDHPDELHDHLAAHPKERRGLGSSLTTEDGGGDRWLLRDGRFSRTVPGMTGRGDFSPVKLQPEGGAASWSRHLQSQPSLSGSDEPSGARAEEDSASKAAATRSPLSQHTFSPVAATDDGAGQSSPGPTLYKLYDSEDDISGVTGSDQERAETSTSGRYSSKFLARAGVRPFAAESSNDTSYSHSSGVTGSDKYGSFFSGGTASPGKSDGTDLDHSDASMPLPRDRIKYGSSSLVGGKASSEKSSSGLDLHPAVDTSLGRLGAPLLFQEDRTKLLEAVEAVDRMPARPSPGEAAVQLDQPRQEDTLSLYDKYLAKYGIGPTKYGKMTKYGEDVFEETEGDLVDDEDGVEMLRGLYLPSNVAIEAKPALDASQIAVTKEDINKTIREDRVKSQRRAKVLKLGYEHELKKAQDYLKDDLKKKTKKQDTSYTKKVGRLMPPKPKYKPAPKYSQPVGSPPKARKTPVIKKKRLTVKDDNLLPSLMKELPYFDVSPHTANSMWKKQMKQMEQLQKERVIKKNQLQAKLQEAEKRQSLLSDIMQKEISHNRRMAVMQDKRAVDRVVKIKNRERKANVIRACQYYDDLQRHMQSKIKKQKSQQEQMFRKLFEEGLKIQKERIHELRQYAKERQLAASKIQENEIDSLENFYRDRFESLAETISKEREELLIREKAQKQSIYQLRRNLKDQMEREIKLLRESLYEEDDSLYFQQLDAENVRRSLHQAAYKMKL